MRSRPQSFEKSSVTENPLDIEVAILTASFEALAGEEELLAAALARYIVMARHEPGCRNVDLVISSTKSGCFLVIQKWDSDALARDHLSSELMTSMAREVVPLIADKPDLDLWDSISAHDLK